MAGITVAERGSSPLLFTKHTILDDKRRIWGYEFACGMSQESICLLNEKSLAQSSYIGLQQAIGRGRKVLASFSEKGVLDGAPYVLPPGHGVVQVREREPLSDAALAALQKLKADGLMLAVEFTTAQDLGRRRYAQADVICCTPGRGELPSAFMLKAKGLKARLLARGVASIEEAESLKVQGFTLFTGPFLKEADDLPERKLTSLETSRFTLLRMIEAPEPDFAALTESISADVALSFRLLSYLNAPYFGLAQKVTSIKQAVVLLGWKKLKNWLRAVLLAEMSDKAELKSELLVMSVQRGRFLELMTREYDFFGFDPSTLFMLGLFSLLDTLLGMPMAEAVGYLPLDDKLKAALLRKENNEYLPLLALADSMEEADWDRFAGLCQKLSMDPGRLKGFFAQAMAWAEGFVEG
ncbi:MAG: HDOD domain-containing protein [Thermodesulfobacteriota bacterium]